MKNLSFLFLLLCITLSLSAERMPDYKKLYAIKNDTVFGPDGFVLSLDSFWKVDPGVAAIITDTLTKEPIEEKEEKENPTDEESDFTSSWKFYLLILAFPVILIGILVLVFFRGKR